MTPAQRYARSLFAWRIMCLQCWHWLTPAQYDLQAEIADTVERLSWAATIRRPSDAVKISGIGG